jgi:DNA-binding XRE family transcriptional regulator
MTQEELAASVGVSSDSVSKWESGKYMPTLLTTVRIADVLNCSLDHLVGRTATA